MKDLSDEKNYRPITCLNTWYKILTGLFVEYMREHTLVSKIWDEGQLGVVEGVLGTVDQLIIDRCIMEEVKQYHRNLAIAFYDYKKTYDKVTAQKIFSIKDFFSKCYQIPRKLRVWSHLLKKSLMENIIFCAVSAP